MAIAMSAAPPALSGFALPGLRVGHFTDSRRPTGCTVVLVDDPAGAVAGVDVRGAAPGTRETDLLSPLNTVERAHAVLLAGGSAFGLQAADGVMGWLEAQGVGVPVGPVRVPIVPAAVLFDLLLGDASVRPDAAAGRAACEAAQGGAAAEGNVGAGAGCLVGKLFGHARAMRGGIGGVTLAAGGWRVAALVACNALGDVLDAAGQPLAGARGDDGRLLDSRRRLLAGHRPQALLQGGNTSIGVVATDARLTKAQATRLAQAGHDGLARAINPVHTAADGDTLFALATGAVPAAADPVLLATLAAEAVQQAVERAVRAADAVTVGGVRFPAVGQP